MTPPAIAAILSKDKGLLRGNRGFYLSPKKRPRGKILLLHGFSASPWEVHELGLFLQKNAYLVFAPRLAGHGASREDFEKAGFSEWLGSARDAYAALFQSGEPSLLIGHSGGGNLASLLALEHPGEAQALILGAPAYRLSDKSSLLTPFALVRFFFKELRFKAEHPDSKYWTLAYSTRCIAELVRAGFAASKAALQLRLALLLMQGSEDPLVSRPFNEKIFKNIPSTSKIIKIYDTTEHNVFHRYNPHQAQVFAWTLEFLKKKSLS
jgi:carboxylesterase